MTGKAFAIVVLISILLQILGVAMMFYFRMFMHGD